jgi:hypothetical protein
MGWLKTSYVTQKSKLLLPSWRACSKHISGTREFISYSYIIHMYQVMTTTFMNYLIRASGASHMDTGLMPSWSYICGYKRNRYLILTLLKYFQFGSLYLPVDRGSSQNKVNIMRQGCQVFLAWIFYEYEYTPDYDITVLWANCPSFQFPVKDTTKELKYSVAITDFWQLM